MRVRAMTEADLPEVIEIQHAGAVVALAGVFPQDRHPFPRDEITERWRAEIADPAVEVHVAVVDSGRITGFAATKGMELLHFGTAIETWGDGTARQLHDEVISRLVPGGRPVLHVFAGNGRARRFYEKLGWRPTGHSRASDYPPHPVLLEYALEGRLAPLPVHRPRIDPWSPRP